MSRPANVFFTSDLHLGHERVAGFRGFTDAEAHDVAIRARWLDAVDEEDTVYVLGDVTGDSRSLDYAIDVLNGLPGYKHLIAGNHDACHPLNRNAAKAQARYLTAFASVQSAARFKGFGIDVLLSHFPYTRDRGDEVRYPQWRLPNLGEWLLHGHTHGEERDVVDFTDLKVWGVEEPVRRLFHSREIHVGLDAWDLTPVPVSTIEALIKENTP